jgi:predicted outer membrane repeat protein
MANIIVVNTAADSGVGSLRAALEVATTGTTIQFAPGLANQTIVLTSGQLEIAAGKQITIDGQGASGLTISGNNASRIFAVNSNQDFPAALTVRNLILANGYTNEQGGAIYSTHKGTVAVEQVTFRNNVANQGGGAIYSAWENNLTVIASKFEGNQAIAGNSESGGGAIAFISPGNLTVRDSDFLNNRGINGGAINSLNGKLTIQNSRFIGNDTTAAYYANGAANPTLRGYGGAVYADRASSLNEPAGSINISDSVFEDNTGRREGGGVYLYTGTQDQVSISRSIFKDNQALALPTPTSNGSESNGGGLVVISNGLNRGLTLDQTAFVNNVAGGQGGGLWTMDAPTTIQNSTFSGNRVTGTSSSVIGGGLAVYSPTQITNSTIANNTAGWVGGGLSATGAAVGVQNTIFYNNSAANPWGIQQHTNRALDDLGGNTQFPPKSTTLANDTNATASIRLADPGLGPLTFQNGTWLHPLLASSTAITPQMVTADPVTPVIPETTPTAAPVADPVTPVISPVDTSRVTNNAPDTLIQAVTIPEPNLGSTDWVAVNTPMVMESANPTPESATCGDSLLQRTSTDSDSDALFSGGDVSDPLLATASAVPGTGNAPQTGQIDGEPEPVSPIVRPASPFSWGDVGNDSAISRLFDVVADQNLAATSPALITYDPQTGTLSYNPNGSAAGFGEGGVLARIDGNVMLPALDSISQWLR